MGKTNVLGIGRKKFNVHVDPRNTVALSGLALWAVALKVELGPWPDQSGAPACKWSVLARTVPVSFTSTALHLKRTTGFTAHMSGIDHVARCYSYKIDTENVLIDN